MATTTITDFPHNSRQLLLPSVSSSQTEGLGFYLSEDGSGNASIDKFTFDENTTGLNGTAAPTITTDGAVESNLIGSDLQYFATFENDTNGLFVGPGSAYALAWAQYNGTSQTVDGVAPDTYQINFQIFPNTASTSPVESADVFSDVTSFTNAPAWFFRSAGSFDNKGIFASAIAEPSHGSDVIQFQAYGETGLETISVNGATVQLPSFTITPNLTAFGAGASDAIDQKPSSSNHISSPNSLVFTQNAGLGTGYSFAWNDTVTDSSGHTHDQVEFALYTPSGSSFTLASQSEFQIADGNAQSVQVVGTTIDGAGVEILAYGDNTGTQVVEFNSSGSEIASLFDPSTTMFGGIGVFGDGRIALTYDNVLDTSGTTQYTTDIYDLRTSGLNVNDTGITLTSDQYFAGTQYGDSVVVGASNVNASYYYVGDDTTGAAPTDHFTGGTGSGWNVAILPDSPSDYTITTADGVTTLVDNGDPVHAGTLILTDVQALAFAPTVDPSGNSGTLTATGDGLFVLGPLPGGGDLMIISEGSTLELATADSGTVTFAGADGYFVDADPAAFTGVVGTSAGTFASGDVLDLQGLGASSTDHFELATALSGDNTILTVTDEHNGHSASVTLSGDVTGDIWIPSFDGAAGVDVVDPPATSASPNASVLSSAAGDEVSSVVSFAENSSDTIEANIAPDGSNYIGSYSLGHSSDANGSVSVGFNFMATDDQINLAPGETLTQSYNITLADAQNPAASQSQTVSVTIGGAGNDNFVFAPGVGADTVTNFNPQQDTLSFEHFTQAQTVQELQTLITADTHGNAVLDLGNHNSITFANTTTAQLQQAIQSGHVLLH